MLIINSPTNSGSLMCSKFDSGVSKNANKLKNRISEIVTDFSEKNENQEVFESFNEIWRECSESNWDGDDSKPIELLTYFNAHQFLLAVLPVFPKPIISADPDGEYSFEWYVEPSWVFSVSIGEKSIINYAGIFGRAKTHGIEFFSDEIPQTIFNHLSRLYSKKI